MSDFVELMREIISGVLGVGHFSFVYGGEIDFIEKVGIKGFKYSYILGFKFSQKLY